MLERRLDPCMSEVFSWADLPEAHMKMRPGALTFRFFGILRKINNLDASISLFWGILFSRISRHACM